ncbi:MAG: hypothetical protein LLF95_11405 [Bacteroidales bacterium]|nr:hypothetical protein [Bacteroidales bacterium]
MDHLHNIDSVHQLQAVQRAIISIQGNIEFSQEQIDSLEKYFHYLYSIGYHQGTRQNSHRKVVFEVDENGRILHRYNSTVEAAFYLGVTKSSIGRAIKDKFKCKGKILIYGNSNLAKD